MGEGGNHYESPESNVEITESTERPDVVASRKQRIPVWIKCFGWFFIVAGAMVPFIVAFSVITGTNMTLSLFGINYQGSELNAVSVTLALVFVVLGMSAYGLLFGKTWGVDACLTTGYLGLGAVLAVMAFYFSQGGLTVRLEPVIQIPYLYKLHKVRKNWR